MKKIMKKVMSLALVVMMVASLLPMTVFADDGVTTVVDSKTFTETDDECWDNTEITTTDWTRITVTIESCTSNWTVCFGNAASYSSWGEDDTTMTFDTAPETSLYVQVMADGVGTAVTYSITTETIEAPAEGSELNPKEVSWDQEVTIAAGEAMYFKTMPYSNGDYRLTIEGGAASDSFKFYIPGTGYYDPGVDIDAVDGVLKSPIFIIDTEYGQPYTYQVVNTGSEDVALWFTVDKLVGASTSYPDVAVVGENTVEIDSAYSGYYYQWVAPEAGEVTIAIDTEKTSDWLYSVSNYAAYVYGDTYRSSDDELVASQTLEVAAGDVIDIMVGTAELPSMSMKPIMAEGTVCWTLDFEAADGVADSKGFKAESLYISDNTEVVTTDWSRVTVTIESGDYWEISMGDVTYTSDTTEESFVTFDVAPNKTVYVQVYTNKDEVVTYKVTQETIPAPAVGSELNPVIVESAVTQTIPAGATMHFVSMPVNYGEYILNVQGEANDKFNFNHTPKYYGEVIDVDSVDGQAKVFFSDGEFGYTITNTSNEEITLTLTHVVASGTYGYPEIPVEGENVAEIVNGQMEYYYSFVATQDGYVTVTMDTENNPFGWSFVVSNYDADIYGDRYTSSDEETITSTVTIPVSTGEEAFIQINTCNPENQYMQIAGTVNWTFAFSTEGGTVTPPVEKPEVGTEDAPNTTLATNGAGSTITVKPGATYFFSVLAEVGEYNLTVTGTTGFEISYYEGVNPNPIKIADVNGVGKAVFASTKNNYQTISFMITNNTQSNQNYIVSLAPATTEGGEGGSTNAPDGTYEKPFEITTNGKYTATCNYDNIYYTFTATADGVLTLVISEEDAANFKNVYAYELNGEPLERGTDKTTNVTEVKKGDVVVVKAYSSTTVDFTATFEEGAEKEEEKPTTKPATNANDAGKYEAIVTGSVTLDTTVVTTLFELTPDKVGTYTITAPTGVKVEDWNTPTFPNNKTTNATNTVSIECTAVGQTFLVGLTAAEGTTKVDVTVSYKAAEVKEEVEWTVYENTVTPEKFETVLEGLEYVDVEDTEVDTAVLGKDGFYHLNSANGPILYVDLNDSIMSLADAADLGKVVEYITEDGEIIAKINYNDAVLEYVAAANKDGLYPLTTDLMTIYKNAGAYAGWYGEDGFLGFTEDDAWMFACYYVPGTEDEEADNTVVVPLPTPEEGKDVVVDKEYLDEHIEQAIKDEAPLELPTTSDKVTMTFDPNELAENDEIELNLTVNVVEDVKDETVAKNDKITDKNFVLKVEFSHEGKLPGKATITIEVPASIIEKKIETLYYHQILADGTLKYICDAKVVDGKVSVTQEHCSDYVLLTEKVDVDVPQTGDSTNFALWFAVLALGAAAIAGSVVMRKKEF